MGAVVDRLEGNTQGKAAVFGMLHTAGLKLRAAPGDAVFSFIQRIGHILSRRTGEVMVQGRGYSKVVVSTSRGADATEQW